ncbi:hypothetical protein D8Y23_14075 [Microbacterium enclense]|uniref:Uncharacterized protein n=1 Tax=Microbacterium enclense TaxID=993073 RepID=A0A443J727_9MICO|nr:hypothetical protein [Microbacterium enclense]RWR16209.1 hypothetical protein D8Y23_14075 [Microbacterium enclense]
MWSAFAAATGGAAAGLTGLTFIVVAFRFDTIALSPEYRNRAGQALTLFLTVVTAAALVTVPQWPRALGAELIVLSAVNAALLLRLDAAARSGQTARTRPALAVALTSFVAGIAASGVLLICGLDLGYYFYAASTILGLTWGVYGAWVFLTQTALPAAG